MRFLARILTTNNPAHEKIPPEKRITHASSSLFLSMRKEIYIVNIPKEINKNPVYIRIK